MKRRVNNIFIISALCFFVFACQKSADEYYNSASELLKSNSLDNTIEAHNILDRVIEMNPNFANAYLARGKAKFRMQYFRDVLTSSENDKMLTDNRKDQLLSDPSFEKTLSDFDKALELDSTLREKVFSAKGEAFMSLDLYENALSNFSEVLEIDSTKLYAYAYSITCKLFLKDTTGASILIDQLVNNNNSNPQSYFHRAVYRLVHVIDKPGACEDLNKALILVESSNTNDEGLKKEIEKLLKINCI